MSASNRNQNPNPLYPEVIHSNPDANSPFSSSSSSASTIYPSVETKELAENLFPEDDTVSETPNLQSFENVLIRVPGVVVHLIEKDRSVELACGELVIVGLNQGDNTVAVLARVGDEIQWPLAKDEAAVKLDASHYFFSLRVPASGSLDNDEKAEDFGGKECEMLNYGLTVASKGQEGLLKELDQVLEKYSCFSVKEVGDGEVLDGSVAREMAPEELEEEEKRELMLQSSAAYWTTLAPNVEDYSGRVARLIAAGSGQLIRGILWCGDVTVDRLNWGNEFLKKRMGPGSTSEISPETMRRIERVKKLTKTTEKMASGVLSGVVKVSGFFTSSIVNSKVGKKFFSLLPGEIVLASLDGFSRVCDAVEVAGRNVMSTTSVVTTGLVSQRYKLGKQHKLSPMFGMGPGFGQDIMYGEQAAQVTSEGLDAAGHAIGTAWAVFKIRKAFNPKSILKPTNLAKAAAESDSSALKSKYKK